MVSSCSSIASGALGQTLSLVALVYSRSGAITPCQHARMRVLLTLSLYTLTDIYLCCPVCARAAAFCRTSAFAVPCSQLKTLKEGFFKQCAAANLRSSVSTRCQQQQQQQQ
jgi:hypothetical protein